MVHRDLGPGPRAAGRAAHETETSRQRRGHRGSHRALGGEGKPPCPPRAGIPTPRDLQEGRPQDDPHGQDPGHLRSLANREDALRGAPQESEGAGPRHEVGQGCPAWQVRRRPGSQRGQPQRAMASGIQLRRGPSTHLYRE